MLQKIVQASDDILNIVKGAERQYRVELRIGNGQREFFTLKACTRSEALKEAEEIACAIAAAKQKSVMYRLPSGDWCIAGVNSKNSVKGIGRIKEMINKFFYVDEEDI
ncbi:hypothetical protein ABD91_01945 [Lysinibacillus sphaericus]|uniref:DUF6018 family natural product bioysynthesis protein n=1 Tax=Lysinibacillus sphaericus TaxID=1421 RepID=UPI0018CDED41|nr:DUF6018 family natural product bioysynthesis protein [Lysinibacillus sphaericus]MBG9689685.1 hypothetical protein [Lysinibacillus sphaericus]